MVLLYRRADARIAALVAQFEELSDSLAAAKEDARKAAAERDQMSSERDELSAESARSVEAFLATIESLKSDTALLEAATEKEDLQKELDAARAARAAAEDDAAAVRAREAGHQQQLRTMENTVRDLTARLGEAEAAARDAAARSEEVSTPGRASKQMTHCADLFYLYACVSVCIAGGTRPL